MRTTTLWSSRGWSAPRTLPLVGGAGVLLQDTTLVFPRRGRARDVDGRERPLGGIAAPGAWTDLPPAPAARSDPAGVDAPLAIGGSVLDDGLLLDLTGPAWETARFPGVTRRHAAAAAGGTTAFVWGGRAAGRDLADGWLLYR